LGPVDVEHAEHHVPVDRRGGHGVPGEQHSVLGEMERDTAGRVTRDMDDPCPTAEVEQITVGQLRELRRPLELALRQVP
jgi:hypothetical protein